MKVNVSKPFLKIIYLISDKDDKYVNFFFLKLLYSCENEKKHDSNILLLRLDKKKMLSKKSEQSN